MPIGVSESSLVWQASRDVAALIDPDGGIVIDLTGGRCHSLNGIGAFLWSRLSAAGGATMDEMVSAVQAAAADTPPSVQRDIDTFLAAMAARGLIESIALEDRHFARPANPIAYQAEEEAGAPDVDDNNGEAVPASAFARAGHIATAFFLLLLTDVILRTRGFSGLCWFMGRWPTRVRTASRDAVRRTQLSEALRLASACYFRHAWCLQRAAALTCLLRFHGIPAHVVIGCRRIPFAAHAWTEAFGTVVGDKPSVQSFYRPLMQI